MTIREATPADAAGIARVHVESWRTTYPGIMPQEHLDALSLTERELTWQSILSPERANQSFTVVAETEDGDIVGFANGGKERSGDPGYHAELYMLYLLQSYQGQGLGRWLMQAAARRLREEGFSTLMLWTHIRNPARGFYEALGGIPARTTQRIIKGITYDDVGYGWDEAALLQLLKEAIF
ncbi:MAG: GNAT family N-acetyltransferase [Janthinobacterium lividum]